MKFDVYLLIYYSTVLWYVHMIIKLWYYKYLQFYNYTLYVLFYNQNSHHHMCLFVQVLAPQTDFSPCLKEWKRLAFYSVKENQNGDANFFEAIGFLRLWFGWECWVWYGCLVSYSLCCIDMLHLSLTVHCNVTRVNRFRQLIDTLALTRL